MTYAMLRTIDGGATEQREHVATRRAQRRNRNHISWRVELDARTGHRIYVRTYSEAPRAKAVHQ